MLGPDYPVKVVAELVIEHFPQEDVAHKWNSHHELRPVIKDTIHKELDVGRAARSGSMVATEQLPCLLPPRPLLPRQAARIPQNDPPEACKIACGQSTEHTLNGRLEVRLGSKPKLFPHD